MVMVAENVEPAGTELGTVLLTTEALLTWPMSRSMK
jgi:hypothetical protein